MYYWLPKHSQTKVLTVCPIPRTREMKSGMECVNARRTLGNRTGTWHPASQGEAQIWCSFGSFMCLFWVTLMKWVPKKLEGVFLFCYCRLTRDWVSPGVKVTRLFFGNNSVRRSCFLLPPSLLWKKLEFCCFHPKCTEKINTGPVIAF